MKNLVMALVVLGSAGALANEGKEHPCKEVKAACEAAGFKKGEHKSSKGLWKDCVDPIMNGQSVAGVSVGPDVVKSCKEKHAEKKAK